MHLFPIQYFRQPMKPNRERAGELPDFEVLESKMGTHEEKA
jgi:hypothetical protein